MSGIDPNNPKVFKLLDAHTGKGALGVRYNPAYHGKFPVTEYCLVYTTMSLKLCVSLKQKINIAKWNQ